MRSTNGHDPHALRLGKDIEGRVIAPDDASTTRPGPRSTADRQAPAAIVRVASDADVARVIAEARRRAASWRPQRWAQHPGHSVSEGGIVLDLSDAGLDRHG